MRVDLLNNRGRAVANGGKRNRIAGEFASGQYFIRVRRLKGDTRYTLTASASASAIDSPVPVPSPTPNPSPTPTPTPIDPGGTAGTERNLGTLASVQTIVETVGFTDDIDYYKFNLTQISDLNATLTGVTASTRLTLYYDTNGNGIVEGSDLSVLSDSANVSENADISTILPIGTYFIEVNYGSFSNATPYTLTLLPTPKPGNVSPDPNISTPFTIGTFPVTLTDLVGKVDGTDSYKFTLSQISDISVTLDGLSNPIRATLSFDANGNGVSDGNDIRVDSGSSSSTGNINFSQTLPTGTYFIDIEYASFNSSHTRYDLNVSQTPKPGNVLTDPNISNPLTVNGFPATFSDLVGKLDNSDYYKFTLNQQGNFNAVVTGLSNFIRLNLFRDTNGNNSVDNNDIRVDFDNGSSTDTANVGTTLAAGTYFIQVAYTGSFDEHTRYDLSMQLT
ncbi:MAG: hypothetical protein HC769_16170 [Cyanobacteria bacterium CRU_2_1]|nr:hypothetical protein [Cyanobacteria bacterium CRU_2_1]